MMKIMKWLFFLALISPVPCRKPMPTIRAAEVLHSLEKALNFFLSHVDEVNLDAGIGSRLAADQLRPYTFGQQANDLKRIVDLSEYVTWEIARSVHKRQPDYYKHLSFLLSPGTFSNIEVFRFHRLPDLEHANGLACSSTPFIEKHSDDCLRALALRDCFQIEFCTKIMSDPQACRYSLTHQILFGILAKKISCGHGQSSSSGESRKIIRMFNETRSIAQADYPETDRDLFMEQIAFGGLVGWSEFFQDSSWWQNILGWQHVLDGCFGNDTSIVEKRQEMQMSHRCLSHRTSVAIAALSQILRYLLTNDI